VSEWGAEIVKVVERASIVQAMSYPSAHRVRGGCERSTNDKFFFLFKYDEPQFNIGAVRQYCTHHCP
jgi:hypothetical protein